MNNIVLCGFMGCGKSSVGRVVAERLGFEFTDTDLLCEERVGMTIPEMFERLGEAAFRDTEHQICFEVAAMSGKVVATGGGVMTFKRNRALFNNDTVVFLDTSFEQIVKRIGGKDGRPLFKDTDKAKALYLNRMDCYKTAADITIFADGAVDEVAERVISALPCVK